MHWILAETIGKMSELLDYLLIRGCLYEANNHFICRKLQDTKNRTIFENIKIDIDKSIGFGDDIRNRLTCLYENNPH